MTQCKQVETDLLRRSSGFDSRPVSVGFVVDKRASVAENVGFPLSVFHQCSLFIINSRTIKYIYNFSCRFAISCGLWRTAALTAKLKRALRRHCSNGKHGASNGKHGASNGKHGASNGKHGASNGKHGVSKLSFPQAK